MDLPAPRRRHVGDRRPGHRRGGRLRHHPDPRRLDPARPGHGVLHALLPRWRGLPGSLHRRGQGLRRRHLRQRGQHHHDQDVAAVPRHGLLGLLHGRRSGAARRRGRPAGLRAAPAVDRPLQDRVVHAQRRAGAGQERPVGPGLRPGPAPVRRPVGAALQPGPGAGRRDHAERQHQVAHGDLRQPRLGQLHAGQRGARRPSRAAVHAVHHRAGAGLRADHRHQRAQGDRLRLPLREQLARDR